MHVHTLKYTQVSGSGVESKGVDLHLKVSLLALPLNAYMAAVVVPGCSSSVAVP